MPCYYISLVFIQNLTDELEILCSNPIFALKPSSTCFKFPRMLATPVLQAQRRHAHPSRTRTVLVTTCRIRQSRPLLVAGLHFILPQGLSHRNVDLNRQPPAPRLPLPPPGARTGKSKPELRPLALGVHVSHCDGLRGADALLRVCGTVPPTSRRRASQRGELGTAVAVFRRSGQSLLPAGEAADIRPADAPSHSGHRRTEPAGLLLTATSFQPSVAVCTVLPVPVVVPPGTPG